MELQELFDLVTKQKASDLLISAGAPPVIRVNGKLYRTRGESLTPDETKKLIYGGLTEEQKKHFEN